MTMNPYDEMAKRTIEENKRWEKEVFEPAIHYRYSYMAVNSRRWAILKRFTVGTFYEGKPVQCWEVFEDQHTDYYALMKRLNELND